MNLSLYHVLCEEIRQLDFNEDMHQQSPQIQFYLQLSKAHLKFIVETNASLENLGANYKAKQNQSKIKMVCRAEAALHTGQKERPEKV